MKTVTKLALQRAEQMLNRKIAEKQKAMAPSDNALVDPPVAYFVAIRTSGNLHSAYAFADEAAADNWIRDTLPQLQAQYGAVDIACRYPLDGLRVGDRCKVSGEGGDVFTIVGRKMYSPDRPGFMLDSGWCEEVVKCRRA